MPHEGPQSYEVTGASLIHGEAERARTAQPEGEKAKVGHIHMHKYLIVE